MSAHERAEARLRAYERLLRVIDENLGPFPVLSDVDPDAIVSVVERALVLVRWNGDALALLANVREALTAGTDPRDEPPLRAKGEE